MADDAPDVGAGIVGAFSNMATRVDAHLDRPAAQANQQVEALAN